MCHTPFVKRHASFCAACRRCSPCRKTLVRARAKNDSLQSCCCSASHWHRKIAHAPSSHRTTRRVFQLFYPCLFIPAPAHQLSLHSLRTRAPPSRARFFLSTRMLFCGARLFGCTRKQEPNFCLRPQALAFARVRVFTNACRSTECAHARLPVRTTTAKAHTATPPLQVALCGTGDGSLHVRHVRFILRYVRAPVQPVG